MTVEAEADREAIAELILGTTALDPYANTFEAADAIIAAGFTRRKLPSVDEAVEAIKPLFVSAGLVEMDAEDYAYDAARAILGLCGAPDDEQED